MGKNIKKFDGKDWQTIASGNAAGISTTNPKLLNEGETVASIDSVIEEMKDQINLMKSNISWLALHGGGGAGGSGGGSGVTANIVLDEADENGILIWNEGRTSFRFRIELSSGKGTLWTTTIELDGLVIFSLEVNNGVWRTIDVPNIGQYRPTLSSHSLLIVANDPSFNIIALKFTILESNISLNVNSIISVSAENIKTDEVIFECEASIAGTYELVIDYSSQFSNTTSKRYDVVINGPTTRSIKVSDLVGENPDPGSTRVLYAKLVNKENNLIASTPVTFSISIVSSEVIVILSSLLSADSTTPTKFSKGGTLTISFVSYLNLANLYFYSIKAINSRGLEYIIVSEDDRKPGTFGVLTTEPIGLVSNEFFEENNNYTIRVKVIREGSTDLFQEADFYIQVERLSNSLLNDVRETSMITNLYCYGNKEDNIKTPTIWKSNNDLFTINSLNSPVSMNCNILNYNTLSGVNNTRLRLQGEAYGVINSYTLGSASYNNFKLFRGKTDNTGLIDTNFTISIAYKADYHPDDNRTILFYGNYSDDGNLNSGIKINVHDILFKGFSELGNSVSVTAKLQDSLFNLIDIVFGDTYGTDQDTKYVKIYLNGAMLAVTSISKQTGLPWINNSFIHKWGDDPNILKELYLGCVKTLTGILKEFTDLDIYDLKIYNTNLNSFEIVTNYINNKARANLDVDGNPDFTEFARDMLRNLITRDESTGNLKSSLWENNQFSNNLIFNNGFSADLVASTPIPLLYINMSEAGWTWNLFTEVGAILGSVEATAVYYDPNSATKSNVSFLVEMEKLGTTTDNYKIKNMNMTAKEGLFWPKKEWFPEKTFTLKADVVDSAHANNASIGKFINECGLFEDTPPMLYFKTDPDNVFNTIKQLNGYLNTEGKWESYFSVKHTLEGFPVIVIVGFKPEPGSASTSDIHLLGIYSFNLGRESYYNLGFKLLKNIVINSSVLLPPCIVLTPNKNDEIDYYAEAWEIKDTNNCTITPGKKDGYYNEFWLYDPTVTALIWENKYSATNGDVNKLTNLMKTVAELPYTGGDTTINSYNAYRFQNGSFINTNNTIECTALGAQTYLGRYLNLNNAYAYYVIAMAFGLVDNLGKNMNIRNWNNMDLWYTCFYDMDTALGLDNAGGETILPDAYTSSFINNLVDISAGVKEYLGGTTTLASPQYGSYSNKLWGVLDDPSVLYELYGDVRPSQYFEKWKLLRSTVLKTADDFVDNYYATLTAGCGELIYNLDFETKYLGTAQLPFMHGTRLNFVRLWLEKRINFLDSLFTYKASEKQDNTFAVAAKSNFLELVNITHSSLVSTLPITYSVPTLVKVTIGANTTKWFYANANTPTEILIASSLGSPNILTVISCAPKILSISDLYSVGVESISGNLPAYTDLNLSGNSRFKSSPIAFNSTFQGTDKSGTFSELRSVDLSNTTFSTADKTNVFTLSMKPDRNPTLFLKVSELNLENSCVTEVSLPNSPLKKFSIKGSKVLKFELSNLAYIDNVSFDGCAALTDIVLDNCSGYTIFNVNGLSNLSLIKLNNCNHLTSINCNNLTGLSSITVGNCPEVKNITITGCIKDNLTIDLSGTPNLTSLTIQDARCSYITLNGCENLTSIDLSNSNIGYIRWDSKDITISGILDLSHCKKLTNVNFVSNYGVSEILFANETTAIPLKNSFWGCTNLLRIYGHVIVTNNTSHTSSFYNCSKFSIHGSNINNVKYNGKSVLNNGRVMMPHEIISGANTVPTTSTTVILQTGKGVTNMDFAGTNGTCLFLGTNCTLFDIYYVFSNIGPLTNLTCIFYSIVKQPFEWTATADNSPNRYMFFKCGNVTNLQSAFRWTKSNSNYFRLFSPTRDSAGNITEDNGLFSPLIKCANLQEIFFGNVFIIDNYVFQRKTGNYTVTNIYGFNPRLLVENATNFTRVDSLTVSNPNTLGDLTNFFKNLPNVTNISLFCNSTLYINYNSTFLIPRGVVTLQGCFISNYATGVINLENYFEDPSTLQNIYYSFVVNGTNTSTTLKNTPLAEFLITDDTFSSFNNIVNVGYSSSGTSPGHSFTTAGSQDSTFESSFCGIGINKYINLTTFPFDILNNCPKIQQFSGIFYNCKVLENFQENLELPGRLFEKTPLLTTVSALFYNFEAPYKLSDNKPFANCTKLSKVDYLFGCDRTKISNLRGCYIPYKFFWHGDIEITESSKGTNEIVYKTIYVDKETGAIVTTPSDKTIELLVVDETRMTIRDVIVTYLRPNATITTMLGCFLGANLEYYVNDNPEILNNPTYFPYTYKKVGDNWVSVTKDINNKTYIWAFDGIHHPSKSSSDNYEDLDEEHLNESTTINGPNSETVSGTLNYCCAPDLFRYCLNTNTVNPSFMFAYSGTDVYLSIYDERRLNWKEYGITGRICPYLLKPISSVTNIAYMFTHCKRLSYYYENDSRTTAYLIPKTFFSYARNVENLRYTFAGMYFPKEIVLNIFSAHLTKNLNIERIFNACHYAGTSSDRALISGVFANMRGNITDVRYAFSPITTTTIVGNLEPRPKSQYVLFTDIFNNTNVVNSSNSSVCSYVYAGYTSSTYTIHDSHTTNGSTTNPIPDKNYNYTYTNE